MERIQFYPSTQLKALLETDAKKRSISVSSLVVELLQEYYNIIHKPTITLEDAIPIVLNEVEDYVKSISIGTEFDLLVASATFRNVAMTVTGKPSTNRATLGHIFSSKIGKPPFANIGRVYREDGVTIKRSKNRAAIYKKI